MEPVLFVRPEEDNLLHGGLLVSPCRYKTENQLQLMQCGLIHLQSLVCLLYRGCFLLPKSQYLNVGLLSICKNTSEWNFCKSGLF